MKLLRTVVAALMIVTSGAFAQDKGAQKNDLPQVIIKDEATALPDTAAQTTAAKQAAKAKEGKKRVKAKRNLPPKK